MAKIMMLENVAVLEMQSNVAKDKAGNPTDKVYHSLVCFEFGTKYPELMKINVAPEKLTSAQTLIGKRCNVTANISLYNQKMSLYFEDGSAVQK